MGGAARGDGRPGLSGVEYTATMAAPAPHFRDFHERELPRHLAKIAKRA